MCWELFGQLLERSGIPVPIRWVFRNQKRGFSGQVIYLLVPPGEGSGRAFASLPEVLVCIYGLEEYLLNNRRELLEGFASLASVHEWEMSHSR